jgi:hypothetical protein
LGLWAGGLIHRVVVDWTSVSQIFVFEILAMCAAELSDIHVQKLTVVVQVGKNVVNSLYVLL